MWPGGLPPVLVQGDGGGALQPWGAWHSKQQPPARKVQQWGLEPRAGGQGEKVPLKQTNEECSGALMLFSHVPG